MRKLFLVLFAFSLCAGSYAQSFSVQQFTADFYLSKEGYFDVVEKYDVEFHDPGHGIYRDFITRFDYRDAEGRVTKRTMYISDIEVPGKKFSANKILGKQLGDRLRVKIGDKEKLVDGIQHYEIRCRVKNALFFNGDRVSFYWNVKSPEWFSAFLELTLLFMPLMDRCFHLKIVLSMPGLKVIPPSRISFLTATTAMFF